MKKAAVFLIILALFFCTSCRQKTIDISDSQAVELVVAETERNVTFAKDASFAYLVTSSTAFRGIELTSTAKQQVSFLFDIYTYDESYDNTVNNGKAILSDRITASAEVGKMSLFFDSIPAGTYLIVLKAQTDFATVASMPLDSVSVFENGKTAVLAPNLRLWTA